MMSENRSRPHLRARRRDPFFVVELRNVLTCLEERTLVTSIRGNVRKQCAEAMLVADYPEAKVEVSGAVPWGKCTCGKCAMETCQECDGDGEVECRQCDGLGTHNCFGCDGEGEVSLHAESQ